MKLLSERERGWIEALIDGEGCLTLSGKSMATHLCVTNADLKLLIRFRALTGTGSIQPSCRAWQYVASAGLLRELLPQIQLISKERQRLLVLEALRIREQPQNNRDFARLLEIQQEVARINSNKGPRRYKIKH